MTAASGEPGQTPPNGGGNPPSADPAYETPTYPTYPGPDPAYGAPMSQAPGGYPPPLPPPGYAPPPPYDAPFPGGYPGYPGYPVAQQGTNTLAIIGLVSSVLGLLCGFGSIIGIVLGAIALSQIKKTGQQGQGLALAAVLVGGASLVLNIIMIIYASS
jgi:hypothetical protein